MPANQIEIMSPVGSYESLMAAIQGGAGSVYFGIEQLNMRAKSSNNFTLDDLVKISNICKENNVKTYITLNIVIYDNELPLMRSIVDAAKEKKIPMRIGVNSGSLSKEKLAKYGVSAIGIVESALEHVAVLEKAGYEEIKISVKASSVPLTIESYRLLSSKVNYPLHLGITEAGTEFSGTIKSSIGIGTLLAEGIGDTIRVSLTADPVREVLVGKEILRALDLRTGLEFISCPTCGRTEIDIISIAKEVEKEVQKLHIEKNISIAVMGCVVNGPGEAEEADVGIAGGKGQAVLFKKGKIVRKISEQQIISELLKEIRSIL